MNASTVVGKCWDRRRSRQAAGRPLGAHTDRPGPRADGARVQAFVTVRSLFTDDWQIVGLERLEEPDSAAITGVRVKRTTTATDTGEVVVQVVDVKLEKLGALTLLARHLGIDKLTVADDRLDLTKLSSTTIATMMEELGLEHR
jgi:hypothetical protein